MKVLLVESNKNLGRKLYSFLNQNNYICTYTNSLIAIEKQWLDTDIAVISRDLPEEDSLGLIPRLLSTKAIPIIITSHKNSVEDRIASYRAGIRDYLAKPFCENELLVRIAAQLRPLGESEIIYGDIKISLSSNTAFYLEEKINLSQKEIKLLAFFVSHPNRLCSRDEILKKVWGYKSLPSTRTVDNHILSLRKKIPVLQIETIRGGGYKLIK
ncbi:response regulator transcription factor [Spartinivicinus poritis]|uniref:Response regulator transcription factor n=1 Tax=Spartinivicinus poritis TaxID=2994640 RepID=A0ABT5U7P5_9GAMM|nr:response regulator transcription factor [Spartinivicinus sp. A2-2]MDE1462398.1 response regulator transcription factor [Spartinivicinus sp. A2-2]